MAARYSDRFFGPGARPGSEAHPDALPVQIAQDRDALDRDALDHNVLDDAAEPLPHSHPRTGADPYGPRQPWHAPLAVRAALAGALVLGVGLGAYGWDRWRDHQTEVVARSDFDLTSSAYIDSFNEDGTQFGLTLHLTNDGDYPVTVTTFSAPDPRLVAAAVDWVPLDLDSGEDVQRVLHFSIDCDAEVSREARADAGVLRARLSTVDGTEHETQVGVDGNGYYGGLGSVVDDHCAFQDQGGDYSSLYAEVVEVDASTDDTVTATFVLRNPSYGAEPESPQTYNVVAASSGFSTELDHSRDDEPAGSAAVRVIWTVRDCAQALAAKDDADLGVELTGQLPSEPTASTLSGYPSPALLVALARLSERACP